MRGRSKSIALVFLVFITAAGEAAAKYPHDRHGFCIGFGVGLGSVSVHAPGWQENGAGLVGDFRLGWALRPELVLGLEVAGVTGDPARCSVLAAAATYHPGNFGLYLRAGAGLGFASEQVLIVLDKPGRGNAPQISQSVDSLNDRNGAGFLGAVGYEWRLTRRFALGPQANFVYVYPGANRVDTFSVSYTTEFNWYW